MTLSRHAFLRVLGFGALSSAFPALRASAQEKVRRAKAEARRMKIKDVEIYFFDIPLHHPFTISIGAVPSAAEVLVRVVTDSGVVGLGEASPFPPITGETQETNISVSRNFREMLVGKDPLAIERIMGELASFRHSNPSAVAAFDMALYDILGKAAGLPLFRLFGGDRTSFETDVTADLDSPAVMAERAKNFVGRGFGTIKVKVGQGEAADIARLQAIRQAVGPEPRLRIDANQGWSVPEAISTLRRMEEFDIQFVEQPVAAPDIAGLRAVRAQSPIPVMADEALFGPADALELVKAEACDLFNIKLMKAGGIFQALRIAAIADAANIRCMAGCMLESRLGLTAAAHVVGSQNGISYADLDGFASHTIDPIIGGVTVNGGTLTLPESPGLGTDVDPAFLKTLRRA